MLNVKALMYIFIILKKSPKMNHRTTFLLSFKPLISRLDNSRISFFSLVFSGTRLILY